MTINDQYYDLLIYEDELMLNNGGRIPLYVYFSLIQAQDIQDECLSERLFFPVDKRFVTKNVENKVIYLQTYSKRYLQIKNILTVFYL